MPTTMRSMTRAGLALGSSLVVLSLGLAGAAAEGFESSPVPDRALLTPTGDPATTQAVTWRTDATVATAQAQLAPSERGPAFKDAATTVAATTSEPVQVDLGYESAYHTAVFEGLQPGTRYLYRVGDGTNWSEWFEFTTADATPEDFSFIYYGDAQNDVKEHVSRVFRNAFTDRPYASLLLHAGDLVNTADADAEWGEWFTTNGWVNGMVTTIATPGNHEYRSGQLSPQWQPQFAFPDNGPDWSELPPELQALDPGAQVDETVYYVDYQGVRFVSLNSNTQDFDPVMQLQAEWLDEVLAENPHKWSVVFFHHPTFSVSEGRDNPKIREYWLPVLEEHEVDLVLQGHDHSYGRGNLDSAEQGSMVEYDGTVYVVSVAGPKMYDVDGSVWDDNDAHLRQTAQDTQLYQLVDVSADEIRYEARTATGRYYDGLTIHKDDDGNKTIIDDGDDPQPTPEPTTDPPGPPTPDPTDTPTPDPTDSPTGEPTADPTDEPDEGDESAAEDGDGDLPDTGGSAMFLLTLAAALTLGGLVALVARREVGVRR